MEQQLLILNIAAKRAQLLSDWLLQRQDIEQFLSYHADGHSTLMQQQCLDLSEQVAGVQAKWVAQIQAEAGVLARLLKDLEQDFPNLRIEYVLLPVVGGGVLNSL